MRDSEQEWRRAAGAWARARREAWQERDLNQELAEARERMEGITPRVLNSRQRKDRPMARGVLDYFPAALMEVAYLSKAGNDKHNPGEPLHHARGKSMDHADCILRHLIERGTIDPEDGILHDVKVAWRALAMLQEKLEELGAPRARAATPPSGQPTPGPTR